MLNQTKIIGYLTSIVRKRASSDIPAYGFFELTSEKRKQETPVIFRIKANGSWIDPDITRGSQVQLQGKWVESISNKNFTCYSYEIIDRPNSEYNQLIKQRNSIFSQKPSHEAN